MDQALFARFRKCAVEVLSVEESAVGAGGQFRGRPRRRQARLVELVMALEEEFDISVPEEELEGVVRVGDHILLGALGARRRERRAELFARVRRGNGLLGTGTPRNSQSGSQPCVTSNTSRRSLGIARRTSALCRSNAAIM